jgi:hypothetical protein
MTVAFADITGPAVIESRASWNSIAATSPDTVVA